MNVYFDNVRVFAAFYPASTIAPSFTPTAQFERSLSPYAGFVVLGLLAARVVHLPTLESRSYQTACYTHLNSTHQTKT